MKKFLWIILALPLSCHAQTFIDVPQIHFNNKSIEWTYANNIAKGHLKNREDRYFYPQEEISRAAALKMLINAADLPLTPIRGNPFPDVPAYEWFAPYVQTAYDAGIVKGYADGKFHPAAQVTRAEFLAMTLRAFDAPVKESEEGSEWTLSIFEFALETGILDNEDATHEAINRGDVAELLFRISQIAKTQYTEKFRYSGQGTASWLGQEHDEKKMTNGQEFDRNKMTAAHRELPIGTKLRVWNNLGKSIIVTVTDRYVKNADSILTLTEKAFGLLLPYKTDMLAVSFEVYSDATDAPPSVPEYVRPELSDQLHRQPPVPQSVSMAMQTEDITEDFRPLWTGVVPMLGRNFYDKVTLREPLSQKVAADTVINISGRTDRFGYKKIIIFLQQLSNENGRPVGDQIYFVDDIDGRNFVVPVHFPNAGYFKMGLVLDDDWSSKVETIEVVRLDRERVMKISNKGFNNDFEIRLTPERQEATLDLPTLDATDLLKIEFQKGNIRDKIVFEGKIKEFKLPYSWFKKFGAGSRLAVDVFAATSLDGTFAKRTSGWRKITYQNYDLIPGFRDIELESISIHDFPRWKRSAEEFQLTGTILEPNVKLSDHAYMITPDGKVRELPLTRVADDISFPVSPEGEGAHTIEVMDDDGKILFNRQFYISENWVLPVLPPVTTIAPSETIPGVRAWINRVRKEAGVSGVTASVELNEFAQAYTDRMAKENFLSHTTPTGQTLGSRIQAANLTGKEFAENIGFGTTLQIALDELKASGSHYQNIITRRWTHVGIGLTKTNEGWYIAQMFSR